MGIFSRILQIILTKAAEIPPLMLFSLEVLQNYNTISCFRGNIKICFNDLINSFTHKIERFSQIQLILETSKEAKHHQPEELTETASYMKSILGSKTLKTVKSIKLKF